jgi:hypothetical protein
MELYQSVCCFMLSFPLCYLYQLKWTVHYYEVYIQILLLLMLNYLLIQRYAALLRVR